MFIFSLFLLLATAGSLVVPAGAVPESRLLPRDVDWAVWKPGVKWQIVIHEPMKLNTGDKPVPADAAIFDIDLAHALKYKDVIPTLRTANKIVICYFNAGAYQSWDPDTYTNETWPKEALGKRLPGYDLGEDNYETYVDIRRDDVVNIMKARMTRAANEAHCDAVDPDNIDAWETSEGDLTGFHLTKDHYEAYLKKLAAHATTLFPTSGRRLLVGQKNAPDLAANLYNTLDFAVLEECIDVGFCAKFRNYIVEKKPVFQLEYPPELKNSTTLKPESFKKYCTDKHGNEDFSELLKHESPNLDGWGRWCGNNVTDSGFDTPTIKETK